MKRTRPGPLLTLLPLLAALPACGGPPPTELQSSALTADPIQVLGFESPSLWSATSGSLAASPVATQGASALAVNGFAYTEVTSAPLASVTGVSDTLLLDVKLPQAQSWGQAQLFASIPSRGVYNAYINAADLSGRPAGSYVTLSFAVPSSLVDTFKQAYTDLTFKVVLNVAPTSQAFLLDNLRFKSTAPSLIELRVSNVNDFVYVVVNGIRKQVFYGGDPQLGVRQNITSWFAAGNNTVRVFAINFGDNSSHSVELWQDGTLIANEQASSASSPGGILLDKTFTVTRREGPALQSVTLTSATPGSAYVDNVYVGATPVTITVVPGTFTFGLGVSQDSPPAYSGSYYEQTVTVAASDTPQTIALGTGAPLPVQKTDRVVVIPIQNTYNYVPALGRGDVSNNGLVKDADITALAAQFTATRDIWFRPFSYGLASWDVTFLPMVTTTPLRENSPDWLDLDGFLVEAGLQSLKSQYDHIVFFFSQEKADGTSVADRYGPVFAVGKQYVGFQAAYTGLAGPGGANAYLLHEMLHNYEWFDNWVLHRYSGVAGLHGANQHGYYSEGAAGETDYIKFYRGFIRGQLAELSVFRSDVSWPSVPATGDLYTGVFDALRVFSGLP